jgi:hypothetical protein
MVHLRLIHSKFIYVKLFLIIHVSSLGIKVLYQFSPKCVSFFIFTVPTLFLRIMKGTTLNITCLHMYDVCNRLYNSYMYMHKYATGIKFYT